MGSTFYYSEVSANRNIVHAQSSLRWHLHVRVFFHAQAGTVSIEVNAGILSNATGTPLPDSGLLQLVVSQSGTFTAPTANSFVTGDNYIAYQFAVNGSTTSGTTGETDTTFTLNLSSDIVANEAAILRWFPGLTLASTSPGTTDTTYGQFRSNNSEGFGDSPWYIPASRAATFAFTTTSSDEGGPYADSVGEAQNPISMGAAAPEPSTCALLGSAVIGLAVIRAPKRHLLFLQGRIPR